MVRKKIMLVDGNSILNRAFYALQGRQLLATKDGLYTNAVYGFINILQKYLEEEQPQYICVAFDLGAPTFRHKEYEGYKAKRKGMPPELAVQLPVAKEVLDAMNIKRLEWEGYEADDIIGTVSLYAENEGLEVVIITGDRDSLQLASDKTHIKIPTTRAGRTETEEYDRNKVIEKYGITPSQFVDLKGLMGDPSDNIPGVPGIGEKTALELVKKFGSIHEIYENIEQIDKKGLKEKLEAGKNMAFMSKYLAMIHRDIPFFNNIEDFKRREFDCEKLYELFKRLEFKSFIEKFNLMPQTSHIKACDEDAGHVIEKDGLAALKESILESGALSLFYLIEKQDAFTDRLVGVAFTCVNGESVYIDLTSRMNEEEFLHEFAEVFENPGIKKYGHDLKNLVVYLKRKGVKFEGLGFDSLIAAYVINPSREAYMISELSEMYAGMVLDPLEQLTGKGRNYIPYSKIPAEQMSVAATRYSEAVLRLKPVLDNIIAGNGQRELYYDIELPLLEVLADMEYYGFKVNTEELRQYLEELEARIESLTQEIYDLAGEEFNINSTKQLGTILFDKLKLPVVKKTKTGYSTDAEVLDELAQKHEIVSKILEYRQLMKLKSTYAQGLLSVINPHTGRIHSSFNQTVTATGRISSTEPNLQNIPVKLSIGKKIRKAFVPENENFILTDADYSQIELRVLAHMSQDEYLIAAFRNGEDIHAATASMIFGIPKEHITPLMRSRAKTVNFGIMYGIGEFSLAKDLGVSRKEAKSYIDEYFNKYPGVRRYMHETIEKAKKEGFVTTLFNRRRYLPELGSSNFNIRSFGERVAMNTPIQGTAADIIKIAMIKVYREIKQNGMKSRLILQVHDELVVETFQDEKDAVAMILKKCMENAVSLSVPLMIEIKTGKNWYETK